ncbi:MAG TPA: hypothetical protein VFH17_06085, partial [Coriobacteriia bacterium]|nr:hypothetical protein [Coriobacteriia bacterium]
RLWACASGDLADRAGDLLAHALWEIESFVRTHPYFDTALNRVEVPAEASEIVRRMAEAGQVARVGPMAAAAGAVAEYVARGLAELSPDVVVENAGALYLMGREERTVRVWAGRGATSGVGIRIPAGMQPVAVCASRGEVSAAPLDGPGAVIALARNGALADAVATALAHRVSEAEDVERAIEAARGTHGIFGVIAVVQGRLGAWGNVRLVSLDRL